MCRLLGAEPGEQKTRFWLNQGFWPWLMMIASEKMRLV